MKLKTPEEMAELAAPRANDLTNRDVLRGYVASGIRADRDQLAALCEARIAHVVGHAKDGAACAGDANLIDLLNEAAALFRGEALGG